MTRTRTRRTALALALSLTFALAAASAADAPSALPAPWSDKDVGGVAVTGAAGLKDGTFTVRGTLDIWGKADGFHFVYRRLDGDGTVVARVTGVENTNNHAKAGVMFRESLDADARHATMVLTPVDGTQFLKRKEAGGVTTSDPLGKGRKVLPYWVKLSRKGDEFTASESPDGRAWTPAGTATVPMGRRAYVGLVSSSHQKDVSNTSTLDHVSVEP